MTDATCAVCAAKSETIRALEQTVAALTELVNLQRAVGAGGPPVQETPASPGPSHSAGLSLIQGDDEPDIEETIARLNAGDLPEDEVEAERLLSQVQAMSTRVERVD